MKIFMLIGFVFVGQFANSQTGEIYNFNFFSENIQIDVGNSIYIDHSAQPNDESALLFLEKIKKSNYLKLLNSLLSFKDKHQLNDWLYYKLIFKTVNNLFYFLEDKGNNYRALVTWFLLLESGFDARLYYTTEKIFYYVKTKDEVFLYKFSVGEEDYICLNCDKSIEEDDGVSSSLIVNKKGKLFSFVFDAIPKFPNGTLIERSLYYQYQQGEYITIKLKVNESVVKAFEDYPLFDFSKLLNTPLTKNLHYSLILQLDTLIREKSTYESIISILEFVRFNHLYFKDMETFGREKWLTPYETLYYAAYDCEDSSMLFAYLVKELLDLPLVFLLYNSPDGEQHVNVGISYGDEKAGVKYNGRYYTAFETTPQEAPSMSDDLHQKWEYKIVGEYIPHDEE